MATKRAASRAAIGVRSPGKRQQILDAAARVFGEKGYERASIRDISEEVGALKGSIYYYFPAKEDLLFEIMQEMHEAILGELDGWLGIEGDAATRLRAVIRGHVAFMAERVVTATVVYQDFRCLSPERRKLVVKARDTYEHAIRELVLTGQREGVFAPGGDPAIVTTAILGSLNWVYQWYRSTGERSPEEIGAQYADLLVDGLRSPAAPGRRSKTPRR